MPASILVVEDERDLRSAICHALTREGFQPRTADTGAQGLSLARSEPAPDLVLLDLNLPDMSGIAVCQALRADPITRAAGGDGERARRRSIACWDSRSGPMTM
ncbi:response regulator [Nannocystis pusilla]|uniref:response regulator n=1 Tax=Nannocystis pusilla TaxID=889268 RepID=UPI003B78FE0F